MEKLDAIWQKQIIKIDEMYDEKEEFKELIEYLTISPSKNNRGRNSDENDKQIKSRIRMQSRFNHVRRI